MARFLMRGRLLGADHEVEWTDGELSGPPAIIEEARWLTDEGRPVLVTATGPEVPASLDTLEAARATLHAVFDRVYEYEGPDPDVFDLPDGAVS